jgi:hypothetical protein
MVFLKINPESKVPIYVNYCIDYRYDSLSSDFFKRNGYENSYYLATAAGAALSLGYKDYCKKDCCACSCSKSPTYCKSCPENPSLNKLKKSIITNLNIALTLADITEVYLLNHQDCGAIRAFLSCSGYPGKGDTAPGAKQKEICINAKLLTYANNYFKQKFKSKIPNMNILLGLIDSNGTVANYDIKTKLWTIISKNDDDINLDALWYGYKEGATINFKC